MPKVPQPNFNDKYDENDIDTKILMAENSYDYTSPERTNKNTMAMMESSESNINFRTNFSIKYIILIENIK